jgi:hypothetical protein
MEDAQTVADAPARISAPSAAPQITSSGAKPPQKRRREEAEDSAEEEDEEDESVDEDRSTDGDDDGASLQDFLVEDEDEDDDDASASSEADAALASDEGLAALQKDTQALLGAAPLQSEIIGGRSMRARAAIKPVKDAYWERFGRAEAERLEKLERKNEQLVELRMWVKDGMWSMTAALTKRSSAEDVEAEHARACAALGITSSDDEEDEVDEDEEDEEAEVGSDDEESDEEEEEEGSDEEESKPEDATRSDI